MRSDQNMLRRRKVTATILVLLALLVVGTWPAGAQPIEIVHLHNAAHGANWKAWLEQRVDEFHSVQDEIRVTLVDVASDYDDRVITMIVGGSQVDVIESTFASAGSHAAQGLLKDLRPFMESDPQFDLNDYPEQVLQSVTWSDGTLFSMPVGIHIIIAHYRTDLFAEAGLATPRELGDGFTWETLVEMGRQLTVDLDGDGTIDRYGIQAPRYLFHDQYALVAQTGGKVFDRYVDPSESRFNSQEARTALRFLYDLYHTHQVTAPLGQSYNLSQGRAAISLTSGPGWGLLYLTPNYDDAWEISPLPAGPGGGGTTFTTTGLQIVAASRHPEAAWEWLRFLAGSTEAVEGFVSVTERMPAAISGQHFFVNLVAHTTPGAMAYIDALFAPGTTHRPLLRDWSTFSSLISRPLDQMLLGEISPDTAAEMMHEQVSAFLRDQRN